MRKRQWKKILSVVLALAMVFSMNVSAFAEPGSDDAAVEQPAAEETAEPAAEVPADEETAPAAEEPADEQPADEKPAAEEPAKEPAPAEEAAPKETTEEAVGDIATTTAVQSKLDEIGWTLESSAADGNITCTDDGTTVTLAASAGTNTLTAKTASTITAITLDGAGLTDSDKYIVAGVDTAEEDKAAEITVTSNTDGKVIVADGSFAVLSNFSGSVVIGDGSTSTLAAGTYHIFKNQTLGTLDFVTEEISTDSEYTVAKGSNLATTVADAEGYRDISNWIPANGSSDEHVVIKDASAIQYQVITLPDRESAPNEVVFVSKTNNKIVVTGDSGVEVAYKTGSDPYDSSNTVEDSGTYTITGLTGGTAYTVATRTPAVAGTSFASAWTTGISVTTDADPDPEGTVTVSGLKFTPGEGAEVSKGTSKNGIYTVQVTKGDVLVEAVAASEALSVNVAAGATLVVNADDSNFITDMFSIQGSGDVEILSVYNDVSSIFESIETGITISSCGVYDGVVVSNNKAYVGVVDGLDKGVKVANKDLPTTIYAAEFTDTNYHVFEEIEEDELLKNYVTAREGYVISTNNALGKIEDGDIDLTTNTKDPYKYGATIWWIPTSAYNNGTPNDAFEFDFVPERLDQGITKVSVYDEHVGQSQAKFHVDAPYSLNKTNVSPNFIFAISTDSASYNKTELLGKYTNVSAPESMADQEKLYTIGAEHLLKGTKMKEGTNYKIFVINIGDGVSKFYSAPAEVGSFTTNKGQTLTIAQPTGKVYAGYQKAEYNKTSGKWRYYDATETGVIPLTFDSAKIKYEEYGKVEKDDVNIGYVEYVFLRSDATPANIEKFKGAETDTVAMSAGGQYASSTLSGNYYVKAFFDNTYADAKVYDNVSSNTISFNILPAPIKVSVKDSPQSVAEKTNIDLTATASIKYINTITGRPINDSEAEYGFTPDTPTDYFSSTPVYVQGESATGTARLTPPNNVSLNKGKYKYSVSKDTIKVKDDKKAPYAAKFVIDWTAAEAGDLDVYGEATLTAEALTVPYGTNDASIGKGLTVMLDSTGTPEKTTDYTVEFYEKKTLSGDGTVSDGSVKVTGLENKDTGDDYVAIATYIGSKCTGDKPKTAAVQITIVKRDFEIKEKTYPIGHSKRNIEIKDEQVSFNAADFQGYIDPSIDINKKFPYSGTSEKYKTPLSANTSAKLNKADIDITKAATYPARIIEYTLDPDVDKNFNVTSAEAWYKIDPAYYAYWILEYAGRGATTGKKFVSFNEAVDANIDSVNDLVKHVMPADITTSWNAAAQDLFKGTNDYISGWVTRKSDGDNYYSERIGGAVDHKDDFAFDALKSTGTVEFDTSDAGNNYWEGDGDVYFYAIVTARATENVTVESIAPVVYDGRKHVNSNPKDSKALHNDINIVLYDTSKTVPGNDGIEKTGNYRLKFNTDYKVSFKNNVNASVKINPALSDNVASQAGMASAVEQLFTEKKRPQVIITGIGDYKGLKTTVYFDIMPAEITGSSIGNTAWELSGLTGYSNAYYAGGANITKINKKGKGITYKYKVTDYIKEKTVTLKKKKDYTETFYSVPDLTKMNQKTVADAKKITAAGGYALIIEGTKNYRGQIVVPFDVKDKSAVLMSELGFKGKNVKYKGTTVSSDKTGFNIKASKKVGKINGKKLVNGTDFIIGEVMAIENYQLIKDGMPVDAGTYAFPVTPTKALIDQGVIDNNVWVKVKINNKKLTAKLVKVADFPKEFSGDNDEVKLTNKSKKFKVGTDCYDLPKSFTSTVQLYNTDGDRAGIGDVVGYSMSDVDNAFDDEGEYVGGETSLDTLEAYDVNDGDAGGRDWTSGSFVWKLTAKGGSKRFTYTLVPINAEVGTYNVQVIGKGAYGGSEITVPYVRKGGNLKKATISVDKCQANINGTRPKVYIIVPTADGKGKSIRIDNDDAYIVKYSNNTKAGSKAKVTVKNSGDADYNSDRDEVRYAEFKGTKTQKFTIDKMPITAVSDISLANGKTYNQLKGTFYATVEDTVATSKGFKAPKVTVYQYSEDGKQRKALKADSDFAVAYDTAKISDNAVSLNACRKQSKSSFTIAKAVPVDGAVFNVYEKKAKSYKIDGVKYVSISASGVSKNATYDEKKKGVIYTGEHIQPIIQNLTVDGETFISNGVSNNKVGSCEVVVTQNTLGKVGVVKYKILLKKANGVKYTLGGSKEFKFKIIPQENNKLILSK